MTDSEPLPPVIGDWYTDTSGSLYEVIAIDDDDGTIEIQFFDGTLEELDADSWSELRPQPVNPPEDWSGSLDIEREDYGVDVDEQRADEWTNPLDFLDRAE